MKESKAVPLSFSVKAVLHYYASFKHPLLLDEIHFNCTQKCNLENVKECLQLLLEKGEIHHYENYYSTHENIKSWVLRRNKGENLAKAVLPSVINYGKFIGRFPFVRFVGLSGSISKGFAGKNYDHDYFIITAKNRLWFCRTALHVVKKFSYVFNLQHKFCMNYFIDEDHLNIEENNLYTAIEISSLLPIVGESHYIKFLANNEWRKDFLPNNYQPYFTANNIYNGDHFLKKVVEFLVNPLASRLNKKLMNWTDNRWKKKWKRKKFPSDEYKLAFKTTLHHSKNHPANYQKKLLSKMEEFQDSNQ